MNVLLLGPQGSGKGTQAKLISKTYGVPHIATGDMIREMKDLPNDLGRELKEIYDRGDLVGDELMIRLIDSRLDRGDTLRGVVLDGYPRTMAQADALDTLLKGLRREIDVVFELRVADQETLLARLLKRAAEEGRSDDTPDVIRRRLGLYGEQTAPLVEYYRSTRGNVVGIHAERPIDEVFAEVRETLDGLEARA